MKAQSPAALPPGSELPRSHQGARWVSEPLPFMRELHERHGDVFCIHLPQEPPWAMVADPALVRQVFSAPADVLHAGEQKRILEPVFGPRSVLLTDGPEHTRARRLLMPRFHARAAARHEERMRAVAAEEVARWPLGKALPAAPRMHAIALRVILDAVLGLDGPERLAPLREVLEQLMSYVTDTRAALVAFAASSRLRAGRFARFRELLTRADEQLFAAIAARRRGGPPDGEEDVLSLLLAARGEDGAPLSDAELRDQLITLLIAGHETVAASLAWALERLARNPDAMARAAAEAGTGGGPYTDAVVRETLRVRPVFAAVPRLVRKPLRVGGWLLPEGVAVTPAIPLVHRRPDVYPDPEAFRPERFLERPPDPYAWIPFGGGAYRCLGAGFALLEMRAVLSTLLARMSVRAVDPEPEGTRRRLLVLAPAAGARVVLERR
jgi:cytochrome P450